jgi:predicted aldo/keto reductase-like oxidoreductase
MGVSRFSPEEYHTAAGMEHCAQVIVKAWEHGINYFDVAPTYCGWRAEEMLGMALNQMEGTVYTTSKSSSTQDSTADALRRRLESSLHKLGLEKITFYNMWGILNYNQYLDVIRPGGPYEGALKAKEEGLIEHIGFSAHCTGEEIERILDDNLFEGMTIGYNAINFKYREKGLLAAQKKGLGVAIMNPLYGGVIPQNPNKFDFIRNEENQTLAQASLLFGASQDAISVVLSGMTTEAEIIENTSCFAESYKFSEKKISMIKEKIEREFDSLCTGCNYCQGCPQQIKTNQLMLAYNQYILTDNSIAELQKYMKDVWRYTEEIKFKCLQCGYCEKKCTQHLPIIQRIQQINDFADQYLFEQKPNLEKLFKAEKGIKIGVYASGPYAKRLLNMYQSMVGRIDFELFFFDSNPIKWGKEAVVESYIVYPPTDIEKLGIEKVIIASEEFCQEIHDSIKYLEKKDIKICQAKLH